MLIAAVPSYLGQDFSTASPGLRFGLYLAIWNLANNKWSSQTIPKDTWNAITRLSDDDKNHLKNLVRRQQQLAKCFQSEVFFSLDAIATAPFTTGLGNEHPLENGFAFLNPYGLPYLPGSGVKGVLRQAARELASGEWGKSHGWSEEKTFQLKLSDEKMIVLSVLDALFGKESKDADKEHVRGALTFWDVIPQIKGDALQVEIMTPHQTHYYQKVQSPHDSGQPIPINFLTVPPGSGFAFHVQCDSTLLNRAAPELANGGQWKILLEKAFEHAFDWCGFGAKTAVGYGAMSEDPKARQQRQEEHARADVLVKEKAEAERLATLSPEDREWEQAQPVLNAFRIEFENSKAAGVFNPGGTFSQSRLNFMKQVLAWTETRSCQAAAELLEASATKDWGRPSKKERWKELQEVIARLKGRA